MAINQLFKIKPSFDSLLKLCFFFGVDITNIEVKKSFTKLDLLDLKIESSFGEIEQLIGHYYLPCKHKKYLECIDIKKCITILRQFLKLYNYSLISSEHYNNSKKYIIYTIIYNKIENKESFNGIINFD
jgi:hypothetical protein